MHDVTTSITLSSDEIDPKSLYAYAAEQAPLTLYPGGDEHVFGDAGATDEEEYGLPSPEPSSPPESILPVSDGWESETVQYPALSQAHKRLSLLYRLSERLRTSRNSQRLLNEGLDLILEAIPEADRTAIMLRIGQGGKLKLAACQDNTTQNQNAHIDISRTLLEWVLTEKIALMTHNIMDDDRLKDSQSIQVDQCKAIICVPIIYGSKVIGVLYVDSANPLARLTRDDVAFTAAVAHELALTMVNLQLHKTAIRNERMAAIGLTISNLAHNIKNLMMMNQNAVDLMKMHLEQIDDQKIEKCWGIVETSLARVNTLSMEMLYYAKDQCLSPTATDINRVIADNTASITDQAAGKGVKLMLDLASDLPHWTIDANEFQRALINLIVNAIDAISDRPDGEVHISSAINLHRQLLVAVEDNGCGLDPDTQSKIFDLFFTTKGTGGSGLGLAMVKKFMRASGGKLQVTSQKDIGTTFTMVFPAQ